MSTPYRRFQHWRAERRRRKKGGCDGLDACGECGCDLFLLSPLLLARVLLGSFGASAVDPYVVRPRRTGGRVAARLVRSYQLHVSARRAHPVCRMTPTCSRYGLQALSAHGLLRGAWLTARRLRRCGRADVTLDPVPARR